MCACVCVGGGGAMIDFTWLVTCIELNISGGGGGLDVWCSDKQKKKSFPTVVFSLTRDKWHYQYHVFIYLFIYLFQISLYRVGLSV